MLNFEKDKLKAALFILVLKGPEGPSSAQLIYLILEPICIEKQEQIIFTLNSINPDKNQESHFFIANFWYQ